MKYEFKVEYQESDKVTKYDLDRDTFHVITNAKNYLFAIQDITKMIYKTKDQKLIDKYKEIIDSYSDLIH